MYCELSLSKSGKHAMPNPCGPWRADTTILDFSSAWQYPYVILPVFNIVECLVVCLS